MGCGSSKSGLHHVDDSVHVMLRHDKKVHQRKGGPAPAYKERAEHPLLKPKQVNTPTPITATEGAANGESEKGTGDESGAATAKAPPTTDNAGPIATEE